MWVYGKADILAKLWNWENQQEDIETLSATESDDWTKLSFDFSKCKLVNKESIKRVLLFIQPGKTESSGTIYIDSIELSKTK